MSTFIIAEVGVNHNGDINLAKEMIAAAKRCGADCVKFQTFKAHEFVSDETQTYTYRSQGVEVSESMMAMFERLEFSKEEWSEIVAHCKKTGIAFSSTAQNRSDLDFLLGITNLPFIKVGSDDLTHLEQLAYYASKGLPMVISAGMAYAYEIEDAIRTIREAGNSDITVLHCVSSYPTEAHEVNLKKIAAIRDAFGVKVGFSDHTEGSAAAVGAVVMGASVIEKHFTLDKNAPGPDHWFSVNEQELGEYVRSIRFIEKALGSSELRPTAKELAMRPLARRKIVAACEIAKGKTLTKEMLAYKRTNTAAHGALDPKEARFVLGRRTASAIAKDAPITLELLL